MRRVNVDGAPHGVIWTHAPRVAAAMAEFLEEEKESSAVTPVSATVAMMNLWQTEMLAGNCANAALVYTETGVLTVVGTAYTGRAEIEGFFAAFAAGATNVGYTITSVGTDTYSGVYDFGAAGLFDYVINLAPGTADIVREVVTAHPCPGTRCMGTCADYGCPVSLHAVAVTVRHAVMIVLHH